MGYVLIADARKRVPLRACVWLTYRQVRRSYPQLSRLGAMLVAGALHEGK